MELMKNVIAEREQSQNQPGQAPPGLAPWASAGWGIDPWAPAYWNIIGMHLQSPSEEMLMERAREWTRSQYLTEAERRTE